MLKSGKLNSSIPGWIFAAVIGGSAVVVAWVLAFPSVDLRFASVFYQGDGTFAGQHSSLSFILRNAFIALYVLACVVAVAGLVLTRDSKRLWIGLAFMQWLFLTVSLAVGPGVVANLALKDQFGRARPSQIVEFGGSKHFTAALVPAKECQRNCSFVSGKSSSIFVLFFATACLWRRHFKALAVSGIVCGGAAGLVRMSQGGHFFSDVVFSAVFMAMTVFALYWLFEAIAEAGQRNERVAGGGFRLQSAAIGVPVVAGE